MNARGEALLSPNLKRYLGNGGGSKQSHGQQQQRRSGNQNQQQPQQPQHGTNGKQKHAKKPSKKFQNLVYMIPAKHLDANGQILSPQPNAEESLNMTQLLFSPGANEGVLHSIFSPEVNRSKREDKSRGGRVMKDVATEISGFDLSPVGEWDQQYGERSGFGKVCGDHTFADESKISSKNYYAATEEKENIPPHSLSAAEFTKTPAKNVDESSLDSLDFHTPYTKTPATAKSTKSKYIQMDESISYHSLNTTRESREHLLASEKGWEEDGDKMAFVTPKQRHDDNSNLDESEDDFFSPLAQYPDDEGSSIHLMKEAKSLLASKPKSPADSIKSPAATSYIKSPAASIKSPIHNEEFFSPLAHHSNDSIVHEQEFDELSPIPGEEGSTYLCINDAKSLLAKPVVRSVENVRARDFTFEDVEDQVDKFTEINAKNLLAPVVRSVENVRARDFEEEQVDKFTEINHAKNLLAKPVVRSVENVKTRDFEEEQVDKFTEINAKNLLAKPVVRSVENVKTRDFTFDDVEEHVDKFDTGINDKNLLAKPVVRSVENVKARDFFEEEHVDKFDTEINVKSLLAKPVVRSVENVKARDFAFQDVEEHVDKFGNESESFNNKVELPEDIQTPPLETQAKLTGTPTLAETTPLSKTTPDSQNLTPHLHSPSLFDLPPGALTVAYVRECTCLTTLQTIHSVLVGSKRGQALRQPRLVQFVTKRLIKLGGLKTNECSARSNDENSGVTVENGNEGEEEWHHFQGEGEWNVNLPPRGRKKSIGWKDKDSASLASMSFDNMIHEKDDHQTQTNTSTPKVVAPPNSPSVHLSSIAESSLDMNLSESFTLGDESAYWKTIVEDIPEEGEVPVESSWAEVELAEELDEIRRKYEEAKEDVMRLTLLLEESEKQKALSKEKRSDGKLEREVEAARLANRALANTLAVSEKDLAEAIEMRDNKARECEQLTTKLNETSDQNAFLSSKVKELEKELASSNSYVDSLYAELYEKSSPSTDLQKELEKRETEWLELENRYNQTIKELQAELNSQNKKVSMEMYLEIMKDSRRYKMDAAEKQIKIDELTLTVGNLRDQIEKMQRSSSKPGLKPISSLHNKIRPRQVSPTYQLFVDVDKIAKENLPPVPEPKPEPPRIEKPKTFSNGSRTGRIAAVKSTWEGKKNGLRVRA